MHHSLVDFDVEILGNDIFKRLSEKYEAKIDVARSKHLIRLSADHATCIELSKLVMFLLENIRHDELYLTPFRSSSPNSQYATAVQRLQSDRVLFDRIQRITSTIIRKDGEEGSGTTKEIKKDIDLDSAKVNSVAVFNIVANVSTRCTYSLSDRRQLIPTMRGDCSYSQENQLSERRCN